MTTIWGRYNAFNVQKVLWLVDELSLDYQHINVGGSYGGLEEPEFITMNPLGKIELFCFDLQEKHLKLQLGYQSNYLELNLL